MKNVIIALLLGIVIGAGGYWFMQQPVAQKTGEIAEQKASEAQDAMKDAAADVKRTLSTKLEAWELRAEDIREEFGQTGKVVRRKARDVGDAVADTAADTRITAEIKSKLAADPDLSAMTISVNTTKGRVTLSGMVSSTELIGKAILVTMETSGVREVVSTLQVK